MADDWRVDNAKNLKGVRLQFREWAPFNERRTHDHCSACWAKFSNSTDSDILHAGYATCDDYSRGSGYDWVCPECFTELKDVMGWREVPSKNHSP
jgi:hypothetical protein